jgi:hypothetical protein
MSVFQKRRGRNTRLPGPLLPKRVPAENRSGLPGLHLSLELSNECEREGAKEDANEGMNPSCFCSLLRVFLH